jgi:hypothetical protein
MPLALIIWTVGHRRDAGVPAGVPAKIDPKNPASLRKNLPLVLVQLRPIGRIAELLRSPR